MRVADALTSEQWAGLAIITAGIVVLVLFLAAVVVMLSRLFIDGLAPTEAPKGVLYRRIRKIEIMEAEVQRLEGDLIQAKARLAVLRSTRG